MTANPLFDALLVLSFGGPEGPDDVIPFLRNVTAGRNVPDERLAEVAEQYELFGGVSPINAHNRALVQAIQDDFAAHDIDLPVYFGNRNWDPFVGDTVEQMAADGVKHALVFATSAFSSYSGCRQYREDLERAAMPDRSGPTLDKLRLFYNHPGFIEPVAANVAEALTRFAPDERPRLVFTAHSVPSSMAASSDYEPQLREAARLIAEIVGHNDWDLVFQSRSGPPQIPWLEPDIGDHLRALALAGTSDVVVCPLGFVSDHMEVLFDLDTQAAAIARELGLHMERSSTAGLAPRFVEMIRQLVLERLDEAPRLSLGSCGPWPDECPEGHCLPSARPVQRPSAQRPRASE